MSKTNSLCCIPKDFSLHQKSHNDSFMKMRKWSSVWNIFAEFCTIWCPTRRSRKRRKRGCGLRREPVGPSKEVAKDSNVRCLLRCKVYDWLIKVTWLEVANQMLLFITDDLLISTCMFGKFFIQTAAWTILIQFLLNKNLKRWIFGLIKKS